MGKAMMEAVVDEQNEKISDASATNWRLSADNVSSEGLSSSASIGYAPCDHDEDNVGTDGSSPLGWPLGIRSHKLHAETVYVSADPPSISSGVALWDMKRKKRQTEMSEVELMKERFAKLLLGEDMSGGGKGVSSALAISNAITNLSASVFGEIWRLEPLSAERKSMWRREMAWLLSVADHIVELVPSWQTFPDGSDLEVMVARPRSDLHINLPALRKLDAMLLESLDSFSAAGEFWYEEQGIVSDEQHHMLPLQRQLEKWWLPSPRVPANGLSSETTKHLRHQRDCVNQILKAALAINNQTLSEMEVPDVFWDALPKNGKASLGEALYKHIASQCFSPEAVLETLDVSTDHSAMEVGGRIEAAIHVWRRKRKQQQKNPRPPPPPPPPPHHHRRKPGQGVLDYSKFDAKASWGVVRDFVRDMHKREVLAGRAERLLLCLKQKFPDLPQSILDKTKIQYNKDVGLSILESYSRVLESLAFNIAARVDEVLYIDEMTKRNNNKLSKQQ